MANDDDINLTIRFQLLDPPTVEGSMSKPLPRYYKTPTPKLIDLLKTGVNNGNFSIFSTTEKVSSCICLNIFAVYAVVFLLFVIVNK